MTNKDVPQPLANTKISQTMSWCRLDPVACARQVGMEAAFLAAAYLFLLVVTGSEVPAPLPILKFGMVFVVMSLAARMLSDSLGDKMAFTAVSALGSKVVSIIAPKIVAW